MKGLEHKVKSVTHIFAMAQWPCNASTTLEADCVFFFPVFGCSTTINSSSLGTNLSETSSVPSTSTGSGLPFSLSYTRHPIFITPNQTVSVIVQPELHPVFLWICWRVVHRAHDCFILYQLPRWALCWSVAAPLTAFWLCLVMIWMLFMSCGK